MGGGLFLYDPPLFVRMFVLPVDLDPAPLPLLLFLGSTGTRDRTRGLTYTEVWSLSCPSTPPFLLLRLV